MIFKTKRILFQHLLIHQILPTVQPIVTNGKIFNLDSLMPLCLLYHSLEFLGDAILDFLITRHIFINYSLNVTPSKHRFVTIFE